MCGNRSPQSDHGAEASVSVIAKKQKGRFTLCQSGVGSILGSEKTRGRETRDGRRRAPGHRTIGQGRDSARQAPPYNWPEDCCQRNP